MDVFRGRRAAALASLLLFFPLALAACGSGQDEAGTSGDGGGAASAAFPVTIEHKFGQTVIPAEPKRVVTVGLLEQDAVLAFGVVPVGTTEWWGNRPGAIFEWAKDELGTAALPTRLDSEKEFEKVAALEPDLIIAMYSGIEQQDYETYSAIAPTIAAPKGAVNYGVSWQDMTLTVGKALGKADEAAQRVTQINERFAALRAEHPEFAGKNAAFTSTYEGIYVYGPQDPRTRILADLGLTLPAELASMSGEEFGFSMSPEKARLVDVDAVVWVDSEDNVRKEVPLFANLNIAQQQRVVFLPEDDSPLYYAAGGFVTVLSLPMILDELVPRLVAAVDGDPATSTA